MAAAVFGRRVEQAKAMPVSPGHVYLALNFERTGVGHTRYLAYAEAHTSAFSKNMLRNAFNFE